MPEQRSELLPDLVGLEVHAARDRCTESGVVLSARDPDGPALGALTWPGHFVVTGQDPAPGTPVSRGDVCTIDFEPERGPGGSAAPTLPVSPPPSLTDRAEPEPPPSPPARRRRAATENVSRATSAPARPG